MSHNLRVVWNKPLCDPLRNVLQLNPELPTGGIANATQLPVPVQTVTIVMLSVIRYVVVKTETDRETDRHGEDGQKEM